MPTLNWIGKEAVEKHHKAVPFRLLEPVEELSCGDADSGNLIVQGDNLDALKALLPRYAGKVKCIYIDPPYNTGMDDRDESGKRSGWVYNDNVNSPEIKAWLGKVVGAESDDLSRHDKWLCMMQPRLALLKSFLKEDGVIFVSIDENEYGNLRILLDEIFGVTNRVGTIIWKNATDNNPTKIAIEHEYILCYAKKITYLPKEWKSPNLSAKERLLELSEELISKYTDSEELQKVYSKWLKEHKFEMWPFQDYKFIDSEGIYTGMRSVHNPGKEGYRYDVLHPETNNPCKQPLMGYRFPESTMNSLIKEGRIIFGNDENKLVELKVYAKDYRAKLSSFFELDGRKGTNQLKEIFPENVRPFDFPKPTDLIEELISFTTSNSDIILDSFAGSGTTAHAVLKANKADNHNRTFILTEMKENIAKTITQPRMKRVIEGYTKGNKELISGLGGGFQYCRLSEEPLFNADGAIRSDVSFEQLAEFVWFMETGTGLNKSDLKSIDKKNSTPYLGQYKDRAIFLLYNDILKDKSDAGGNVLNSRTLELLEEALPDFKGQKIVYGARTRFDKTKLARLNITFHQLPYELAVKTWF
ncbi:site-specific DNA-methyltransferase [Psychrobacter sp. NG25]|uniref:site-specific DNA-methyltransferase n=1 Tax=Psychrobacter sp. NG25 TaxID=2782005 RepID=UPI0018840153|nr:site-specific DNA-methyltransferase [Psychrobacter sp. NG25]MBF0657584.1 site-specific DNA-methyltransferase [Psychrobacter sp. NG25]